MESLTFVPTFKKVKLQDRGKMLNGKSYSLINNINLILDLIIRNTLKYNKLTSADEIYENLIVNQNGTISDLDIKIDINIDVDTIISICNALCADKGVLIKMEKNGIPFYRLNYQENI